MAFASSADTEAKTETFTELAAGVYALTAEGDPNVGAIEAEDFLVCFEARATPVAARRWLSMLRERTDKPVRYLVLSHYHAVRVLGASAFGAAEIITHTNTRDLILERGKEDWASELGRMPRLFEEPESIPGLTVPTLTFSESLTIPLGGNRELRLVHCGLGHTAGDIVAWLPQDGVLFAGDLVEAQAALYTGDAFHTQWATSTLNMVASFPVTTLIGGRGAVVTGGRDEVKAAVEQSRHFLNELMRTVGAVHAEKGTMAEAFASAHEALAPEYGGWPIFEHCLPFNVQRYWDELDGIAWPRIWTAERDREVWAQLKG